MDFESESFRSDCDDMTQENSPMKSVECVERLQKENQMLKAQFDEALALTSTYKEVQDRNTKLINELNEYKNAKEELEHRISLALQANSELSIQLDKQKRNEQFNRQTENGKMSIEVEKTKSLYQQEIDRLNNLVVSSEDLIKQYEIEKRVTQSKTNKVIQNSKRFFGVEVTSLDSLIDILDQKCIIQPSKAPEQINVPQNDKSKKYKAKIRNCQCEIESLKDENKEYQMSLKDTEDSYKKQIKGLENQMLVLKEQYTIKEGQNASLVQHLESRIESLKADLMKTRDEKRVPTIVERIEPKIQIVQPKEHNVPSTTSIELEICKEQLKKLEGQTSIYASKIEELNDYIQDIQEKNTKLEVALEKKNSELSTLNHINEETAEELQMMREALHSRVMKPKDNVEVDRKKENREKRMIINMKKEVNDKTAEMTELKRQLSKQETTIEQGILKINNMKEEINGLKHELNLAQEDRDFLKNRIDNIKQPAPEDVVPSHCLFFPETNIDLSTNIERIIQNKSLQVSSKIQSIYQCVKRYYEEEINKKDSALIQYNGENQAIRESINKFFVDASILLSFQPMTFDDFFTKDSGSKFMKTLYGMRTEYDRLSIENKDLRKFAEVYQNSFGKTDHLIDHVNALEKSTKLLIQERESLKKTVKKLKSLLIQKTNDYDSEVTLLGKEIENLKSQSASLQNDLDSSNRSNKCLRTENQQLIEANRVLKAEKEDNEAKLKEYHEDKENQMVNEHSQLLTEKNSHINHLNNEIGQMNATLQEKENQILKLNAALSDHNSTIKNLESELSKTQDFMTESIEKLKERSQTEKDQLQNTYSDALQELSKQCEEHRQDVQRLASALTESENKYSSVQESLNKSFKEKKKLIQDMKLLQDQIDRERKLMEATSKTKIISIESSLNSKLETLRTKSESEKRSIFGLIAEEFHDFYNPTEKIDDKSFRRVIRSTKERLQQLNSSNESIRRMLSVKEEQTTEDAVAQMLLSNPY